MVAGALIDYINDEFGADIPQLNMYEILNEGGWDAASPFAAICGGCDPKDVVMTEDAFRQLYEMMLPELAARWNQPQQQRLDSLVERRLNLLPRQQQRPGIRPGVFSCAMAISGCIRPSCRHR